MKFRLWKTAHTVWQYVPHFMILAIVLTIVSAFVVGAGGQWWHAPAAVVSLALVCGLIFGAVVLWNLVNDVLGRKRSQEYAKEFVD